MSTEAGDVSLIQDEDLLRRMWQQTEDFGRKKEIRARMYKLREQRLKEFYTTGEVLSDVLSTSTSSLDGGRKSHRQNISSSNLIDTSMNSQSSSQIISKSSSYTTSSAGGGYSITHADSLADEGFLTLKSKEIRDSESPTREFHQRQERNAMTSQNENMTSSTGNGGGYWRIVQESSSGSYESTGKTDEGGDMIIHSTSRSEHRNLAGDSEHDDFTTANQVSSSEKTTRIPRSGAAIEFETTSGNSVVSKKLDDVNTLSTKGSASNAYSYSSSASSSYATSSNQKYQQNEKTISSIVKSNEDSKRSFGVDDSNVHISESTKLSSTTGASHEIVSSANAQSSNQSTKHRVTQRSQTGECIGRLSQSTEETTTSTSQITDKTKSPDETTPKHTDTVTVDVNITRSNLSKDERAGSTKTTSNNKVVEQRIMSELHKLDSYLSTQNTTADSTPVTPAVTTPVTRDTNSWTVVSTTSNVDKNHAVNNETDEFIFRSGQTTVDQKDSKSLQNRTFIEQERTSSIVNEYNKSDTKDSVDVNKKIIDESDLTRRDKPCEKKPTDDTTTPVSEGRKKSVPKQPTTQDTTLSKDSTDTTGQYITTYQQAYTNKRISVDVSPTHDAFARSLRASPERATPSSTRSSSKTSLDRSSPERLNKSPTRTYRNKTSVDNTLATGRTSPDKLPINKSSPTRASPEKSITKISSGRSSPEKTPGYRSSPSRVSPEKTTKYPEGTNNKGMSPEKTKSPISERTSPIRASPEKTTRPSVTDRHSPSRSSPEKTARPSVTDRHSPSRSSPEKTTRPSVTDRHSPSRSSPEKTTRPSVTDRHSPSRSSPEKTTRPSVTDRHSPSRSSPENTTRPSVTDRHSPPRSSPEKTTKFPYNERTSPTRVSQDKTKPIHGDRTSPMRRSPDKPYPETNNHIPERRVSSGDKPRDSVSTYSPTRKTSDSTKSYSPVSVTTSKDTTIKTTVNKEKRKLSSGLSRATTKKRSSTPGVSPHTSPTRMEDKPLRPERQSRPRSRGTSSRSNTDSEDSDSGIRHKTNKVVDSSENLPVTDNLPSVQPSTKYIATINLLDHERTDIESQRTCEYSDVDITTKINKSVEEVEKDRKPSSETYLLIDEISKEPHLDTPEGKEPSFPTPHDSDICHTVTSDVVTVSSLTTSEDKVDVKTSHRKYSAPKVSKVPTKKPSKGDIPQFSSEKSKPSSKTLSPQKSKPQDKDTKRVPATQKESSPSDEQSPSRTPHGTSPVRHVDSPKSLVDKLPRDKSPEYSSEGSIVTELYPKQTENDKPRNRSSPVKQQKDDVPVTDSPDSSPERGNFKPIKCFRTSPEVRPSTLEFTQPPKQSPNTVQPTEIDSPTKAFKGRPGDDRRTLEDDIDKPSLYSTKPSEFLKQPSTGKEPIKPSKPISTRSSDIKKSPERPNTSPAPEDRDFCPIGGRKMPTDAGIKRRPDELYTQPSESVTIFPAKEPKLKPRDEKQFPTDEFEDASKENLEPETKYSRYDDRIQENNVPKQNRPTYASVNPLDTTETQHLHSYTTLNEAEHLTETVKKTRTDYDTDEKFLEPKTRPKSPSISPCSSSPERPSEKPVTRTTAEITLKISSGPRNDEKSPTKEVPQQNFETPKIRPQKAGQHDHSDSSPDRESTCKRTPTDTRQPHVPNYISPKPAKTPSKISNIPRSGPAVPEKPTAKKQDHAPQSPTRSSDKPKAVREPRGKYSGTKIPASTERVQRPYKSPTGTQTSRRQPGKTSPSPDTSPERIPLSPVRKFPDRSRSPPKVHKTSIDSSPNSRSPSVSPERPNDTNIYSKSGKVSPDRSPSSSPERYRSPEKIKSEPISTKKPSSKLPQTISPSSQNKYPRIPGSGVRDRPNQSPSRPAQSPSRPVQTLSRPGHSPMRSTEKPSKTNQSPSRPSHTPTKPSQPITRTSQSPARYNQSPARPSQSPSSPKYQVDRPRKPGPDTEPTKSAFVRTPRKPEKDNYPQRVSKQPVHAYDHQPSQEHPKKTTRYITTTKVTTTTRGYPTPKEPKYHKPDEVDDERSTDRSSTVSSPETVKTAGDITTIDRNFTTRQETEKHAITTNQTTRKRTEMYVPQLSTDRDLSPSDNDLDENPVSLSSLTAPTIGIKDTNEHGPSSLTISITSNKKITTHDIHGSRTHEEYYSDEYDVDLQDETPPEEFLVEDDSPRRSPIQPQTISKKPKKSPERPRGFESPKKPRDESPKAKTTGNVPVSAAPTYRKTITVTTKDTRKTFPRSEPQKPSREIPQKQEPRLPVGNKKPVPSSQPKTKSRDLNTTDSRITRSSSDKNVVRKQSPSPSSVQPRRQISKPEMTVTRLSDKTTIRSSSSVRQQQVTAIATTKVTNARITKSPAPSAKITHKKIRPTEEPANTRGKPKTIIQSTKRDVTVSKKQRLDVTKGVKPVKDRLVNGITDKPYTSSSDEEQEIPDIVTDEEKVSPLIFTDDEPDEAYIQELEELRRTEEQQYASKITAVRTIENKLLSPNQDIPGIIIQPLKSSRESSPECPRRPHEDGYKPRYADRISEPEDDDDIPGRTKPRSPVFQKPILHPEPLDEEYTDEEKPKSKERVECTLPKERPETIIPRSEQVTDLDESDTDEALKNVSVADRVNRFLETTKNAARSVAQPSEPVRPTDSSPKRLDSPSTVRRARAMFETIANNQTTVQKDTIKQKEILSIYESRRDSPTESPIPDNYRPDEGHPYTQEVRKVPEHPSAFTVTDNEYRPRDIPSKRPETRLPGTSTTDYPSDTEESPYKDSSSLGSVEESDIPRIPTSGTYLRQKSPSPERPHYQNKEPVPTQPRDKSPSSKAPADYSHRKPLTTQDQPGHKIYDTYTKIKPSKDIAPEQKSTVTQLVTVSNKYDTVTIKRRESTEKLPRETSPHKDSYPIKKSSPQEPSYNTYSKRKPSHDQSPEPKDSSPIRKDSLPRKEKPKEFSTDTYPKKSQDKFPKESEPTEFETDKRTPDDTYTKKQPIREDFPEDNLIQTFTKDTTTQREILRQKDILSRPSVFEARRGGQKVAPSKPDIKYDQPHEPKTCGYPDRYPSDDDTPSNKFPKEYSTDTFTKKKPSQKDNFISRTEPSYEEEHPKPQEDTSSVRRDSQPKKGQPQTFSTDTFPRRKPMKEDNSPARKDSTPKRDSPSKHDISPRKDHPYGTSPTRKDRRPQEDTTPHYASPIKKFSSPKDKPSTTKVAPVDSRESSPSRKYSSPKDTSPTRKDSYPRGESPKDEFPTRKYSTPKDESPTRKDSYPRGESPREEFPTRKYSTPKDESPTRKDSYPRGESPREEFPTRKYSTSKDESPTRKDSYPRGRESSREEFPTRKYSTPKDESPTRKDSYPRGRESPREEFPIRKYSTPKDESPTRKDSHPRGRESPREEFPTRKYSTPKDESPTRKDSSLKGEFPHVTSPLKKVSPPKDKSPTRKDFYPKGETPRDTSPTRKYSAPKDTSPARKDSHPVRKQSHPDDSYPRETSPTRRDTSPKRTSPLRQETKPTAPRKDSLPKDSPRSSITSRYPPKEEPKPVESSTVRGSGRFGVNLRRTGSAIGSTIQRRLSGETSKPATTPDKKEDELNIEEIFDLELLERMLEKAVGYEQRRTIRGQIRIVRRMMTESSTTITTRSTVTTEAKTYSNSLQFQPKDEQPRKQSPRPAEPSSDSDFETQAPAERIPSEEEPADTKRFPSKEPQRRATPDEDNRKPSSRKPDTSTDVQRKLSPTRQKPFTNREPDVEDSRPFERRPNDVDGQRRPSSPHKSYPETRPVTSSPKVHDTAYQHTDQPYSSRPVREPDVEDSRPFGRRPSDVDGQRRPSSPHKSYPETRPVTSSPKVQDSKPYSSRPVREPDVEDSRPFGRRPSDVDGQRRPSSPQKSYPETRPVTSSPKVQDSKPYSSRSESAPIYPRDSKPTPEKAPDWKSGPVRKPSKTELNIELKPATSPVKSPIKKSSLGEPPREAFPTDSVTSSYGVGPTDENGRPLFGLSALRRRQSNNNNNIQIPQDTVDTAPTYEPEPEEVDGRPSEIRDSSGRPLFGGLRALKATTKSTTSETSATTTTRSSTVITSTPRDRDEAPSTDDDTRDYEDMPEQTVSSHLRELVSKHEQHSRGNTVSQPTAPRQKPRAKLRDSFILQSQDTETEKHSNEDAVDTRVISQRAQSLRAIIQKHEQIAHPDDSGSDRVPRSGDEDDIDRTSGDNEISRRPGILKKWRDGDQQVVTESTSKSSATVISSRGVINADGKVSLTRDVIQGETVARSGEEPVTRITRTRYAYKTPEDKTTPAITDYDEHDYDQGDSTRKPSTSSRRSSSGKTPSPTRGLPDDGVKPSSVTTSSVTTSNSTRRSKVTEDDRKSSFTSKFDKVSSISSHDDTSRRSRVTTDRTTDDDRKFVSSTVLSRRQKPSDESERRDSVPVSRGTRDSDTEPEHSTPRDGKYVSSTTTTLSQTQRSTEKTPASVKRQIFTDDNDDVEDTRRTSTSSYGKYSSASSTTVSKSVIEKGTTSSLLDSERRYVTTGRDGGEDSRIPLKNRSSVDYDDESDGYQTASQYVSRITSESETPRSSRRYSSEVESEEQMQRSETHYSSSSMTQSRTVSGGAVTTVETTSSRSSTPNQITGPGRRRSSATFDGDRETSPTPSTGSTGFSRVARGGSVRALSQKFQQAAAEANSSDSSRSQRSYPKAGLIFRSASFRLSNGTSPATTPTREEAPGSTNLKQTVSSEVRVGSTSNSTHSTSHTETEGKSFLNNQTRVTGVQDVITRMKNAEQDVQVGDTDEDVEARTLLNKFLGAQVILQGMEPLVKASQSQSAALVSQVERQRVLSQKTTTASTNGQDLDQDLEEIWDERVLRQLLEKCSDYEGRRQIRARLRVVMAEQKACAGVVAAALADEESASVREQEDSGEILRHSVEEGHSESKMTSSSTDGSTVTRTEVSTKSSSFSATAVGKSKVSKAPPGKAMSPFAKFQQLDRQSSSQSAPRTFK